MLYGLLKVALINSYILPRDRSFFIAWSGGGAGGGFLLRVLIPRLLSQPPQKASPRRGGCTQATKSQTECYYMQASDIYINTYVSWTLNNNFTYLVIWQWTELSRTDRWKQSRCRSRPSHCRILPHIFNPLICGPVTFTFGTTRYCLCSQTLWCIGNDDIE